MILSRGFAGSERTAAQMANVQCGRHDVAIVLKRNHTDRHGVSITRWLDPRVRVFEVGRWLQRGGVARAINAHRPHVIHAHLRRSTKVLARIRPAATTIVTLHIGLDGPHFVDMDGMICIAGWQLATIPACYKGHVYHIHPAHVPHRRLSSLETLALRRELGVQPHELLIGGVGRLADKKGFDTLIEAFKRADLPNARLVILGEGRERKSLERLCTEHVSLPGFRTNIKDYYQAFDLFVCPSIIEPFGLVILEALDAGVPIIASDASGPREILERCPGALFPAGDVEALARQLRAQASGARSSQPCDLSPYALHTVAAQTEAAYRDLIAGSI